MMPTRCLIKSCRSRGPVERHHPKQEEEPDRHEHMPPRVELRIGDAVGREDHAQQGAGLEVHEPSSDPRRIGGKAQHEAPPDRRVPGPERKPGHPGETEDLQRPEAQVEGKELRAAALERRARGDDHVHHKHRREPAAEPRLNAVLHQEPSHPGDEVQHGHLVEHLQLEAEGRVEGDASEPHQYQEREGHSHVAAKGPPGEPQRSGEDHRKAGNRVERLADPREQRVILLAPVDTGGGSSPEAHRIHGHGFGVYPTGCPTNRPPFSPRAGCATRHRGRYQATPSFPRVPSRGVESSSGVRNPARFAASKNGRISISLRPDMGLGQRFAQATASSMSLTSQIEKPAISSLVSANGPSMTVRPEPSKAMRLAWALGLRPAAATMMPALTSSSVNRSIASNASVVGGTPFSVSSLAFTSTMTRIVCLLVRAGPFCLLIGTTIEPAENRHRPANYFSPSSQAAADGGEEDGRPFQERSMPHPWRRTA